MALVTGGGSGIGRSTVQLLASRGARVVAADIDREALHATVEGWSKDQVQAALVDVTSPGDVDAMVAATVRSFGRLDIAVNAAGVSGSYANIVDQGLDEWRRVIEVNLTSVFLCLKAEIRQMLRDAEFAEDEDEGDGDGDGDENGIGEGKWAPTVRSIVNIASAAGSMGVPGLAPYSASKHGVIGLTKSVALEYARSGLRVNAVLPGTVRTPMLQRFAGGDEGVDKMGKITPLGRAAEPDEIAQAVVWLCGDQASYVTGHAFAVDGGALAT